MNTASRELYREGTSNRSPKELGPIAADLAPPFVGGTLSFLAYGDERKKDHWIFFFF
jgi:hypothetical protein